MAKPGLYANINKRKKAGTSRSKSKSTISPEAYANMKAGFPKSKKKTAMGGGMMMKKKPKMKKGGSATKGTHVTKEGKTAKKGLWYNIHQKRKRGAKMRKPGAKGAPTAAALKRSQS